MKSRPGTFFSAGANELPIVCEIASASSVVTWAGASVTFSTRRDAETTTPPSCTAAFSRVTSAAALPPAATTTPTTVFDLKPRRYTFRSTLPVGTFTMTNLPFASDSAESPLAPAMICAPDTGAFDASVTVPAIRPVWASASTGIAANNAMIGATTRAMRPTRDCCIPRTPEKGGTSFGVGAMLFVHPAIPHHGSGRAR